MAMNTLQKNTVSDGAAVAKQLLTQIYPILQRLNVIYDAQGGVKSQLDDNALASEGIYSNLTKTELDDGMFVLTSTLRTAISDGLTQLEKIAARA